MDPTALPGPVPPRTAGQWAGLASAILIPIGLAALAAAILMHQSGFLHAVGIEPRVPSTTYNAWSGFLSDLGEYTIAAGLFTHLYHTIRAHTCREHRCRRLTWDHYVDQHGQSWPACHRHHPLHPARLHPAGRFHFAHLHAQRETQ